LGVPQIRLLEEADLPSLALEDASGVYIEPSRLAEAACRVLGDPLGLVRANLENPPQLPHTLGIFAATQDTLRGALECVSEYRSVIVSGLSLELSDYDPDGAVFLCQEGERSESVVTEWATAALISFIRAATSGRASLRGVWFRHSPRTDPAAYRDAFGIPVQFNQATDGLRLGPEDFQSSLNLVPNTPALRRELESLVQGQLPEGGCSSGFRSRCILELRARVALGEQPTLAQVAVALGTSPRTFQRQLDRQGVNFRRLKSEVVVERIKSLLVDEAASVAEIAGRTGFASAGALCRAFKRLTGTTPLSFRRSLRS